MKTQITPAAPNLREVREALGLSQSEVAAKLGVDQSLVSRIENGHTPRRAVRMHIERIAAEAALRRAPSN